MKTITLVAMLLMPAIPAQAQQVDSRWEPWLGCWQLLDESVREPIPAAAAALGPANTRQSRKADAVRVCVTPSSTAAGVMLRTTVEDRTALEQTVVADGTDRPVTEGECRGSQRAEWSRTGERLFARADLTCANQAARRVSGLAMIVGGATWIDIQAIDIGGRENIRVRRYRRAGGDRAVVSESVAPRLGAGRFTVDDVKEAAGKVSPRAVEAALIETGARFDLHSRALVALDEAGVADSVIDLMVALSYPKHFVVERRENLSTLASIDDPWNLYSSSYQPYGFFYPYGALYYSDWGSYLPYYYSPFGYAYWAGYGGGFLPPGFVTVGGTQGTVETGAGRAVNGVGYTRIVPRSTADEGSGRRQTSDETSSASARGSSDTSTSSSSSSGGATSSGFSSGSSSSDTGRTAEPR